MAKTLEMFAKFVYRSGWSRTSYRQAVKTRDTIEISSKLNFERVYSNGVFFRRPGRSTLARDTPGNPTVLCTGQDEQPWLWEITMEIERESSGQM